MNPEHARLLAALFDAASSMYLTIAGMAEACSKAEDYAPVTGLAAAITYADMESCEIVRAALATMIREHGGPDGWSARATCVGTTVTLKIAAERPGGD